MEQLAQADTLRVQQKKEWGEILTGFETKNKYAVMDASGQPSRDIVTRHSTVSQWSIVICQ